MRIPLITTIPAPFPIPITLAMPIPITIPVPIPIPILAPIIPQLEDKRRKNANNVSTRQLKIPNQVGTQTDRAIDSVLEGFSPHQVSNIDHPVPIIYRTYDVKNIFLIKVKMVLELLTRLAATPTTTPTAPTTTHNETNFNNTNDFTNAFNAHNTNSGAGPNVDCNDHSKEEPSTVSTGVVSLLL